MAEQKKESLADDACEKILSLIIGENIASATSKKVQNKEEMKDEVVSNSSLALTSIKSDWSSVRDPREALAMQMGDFAC